MKKTTYIDLPFFQYDQLMHGMGFTPFHKHPRSDGRFKLGRYRCHGRAYYLKRQSRSRDPHLWDSTIVMFCDTAPGDYACVKTMIKAANHFALIKARNFVELNKVFDLCS